MQLTPLYQPSPSSVPAASSGPRRVAPPRGFTLIEVLLVLLILGMLATLAIFAFSGTRAGAKIDTTKIKIKEIASAIERYNLDIGHYPTQNEGGLQALITEPTFDNQALASQWRGPYLKSADALNDAWGNPINYELVTDTSSSGNSTNGASGTTSGPAFHLWSNGPDGQEGTSDDIRNWSDQTTGNNTSSSGS